MSDERITAVAQAYRQMAQQARYRPQYIEPPDSPVTRAEAEAYARDFCIEDDKQAFDIGCANFPTLKPFVYAIEAARLLAGTADAHAIQLLKMALVELEGAPKPATTPRG